MGLKSKKLRISVKLYSEHHKYFHVIVLNLYYKHVSITNKYNAVDLLPASQGVNYLEGR